MNQYIDHTLLKPTATYSEIIQLCEEAHKYKFKAVCVPPNFVKLAKLILSSWDVRKHIPHNQISLRESISEKMWIDTQKGECNVKVCTVIGFPFGYSTTDTKKIEIIRALEDGADELDIVQCVSAVKNGDYSYVKDEIAACLQTIRKSKYQPIVKVILESGILTDEEIIGCCSIYSGYAVKTDIYSQLDFLKTSTGCVEQGASVHQVELINKHKHNLQEIKASGGIRDIKFAEELIAAGATRLGCSSGVKIMEGKPVEKGY